MSAAKKQSHSKRKEINTFNGKASGKLNPDRSGFSIIVTRKIPDCIALAAWQCCQAG